MSVASRIKSILQQEAAMGSALVAGARRGRRTTRLDDAVRRKRAQHRRAANPWLEFYRRFRAQHKELAHMPASEVARIASHAYHAHSAAGAGLMDREGEPFLLGGRRKPRAHVARAHLSHSRKGKVEHVRRHRAAGLMDRESEPFLLGGARRRRAAAPRRARAGAPVAGRRGASGWIAFVKAYAAQHGLSYSQALRDHGAAVSAAYHRRM